MNIEVANYKDNYIFFKKPVYLNQFRKILHYCRLFTNMFIVKLYLCGNFRNNEADKLNEN